MQTFLPYPSFTKSALSLDYRRLGKQRVEGRQILEILLGETDGGGWKNHPAVKMWRGYESALAEYVLCICDVWVNIHGYKDNQAKIVQKLMDKHHLHLPVAPPWFGDPRLHLSHQSRLIQKDSYFYEDVFPDAPKNIPYWWPVK